MQQYPDKVLKIHKDFDDSADRALAETRAILANPEQFNKEKVTLLQKFGFNKVPEVIKLKQEQEKRENNLSYAQSVEECSKLVPHLKFISDEDLKKVCLKWNLVIGSTNLFTGFVPLKNLDEITKANIPSVTIKSRVIYKVTGIRSKWLTEHKKIADEATELMASIGNIIPHSIVYTGRYIDNSKFKEFLHTLRSKSNFLSDWLDDVNHREETLGLEICAPAGQFDLSNHTVVGHEVLSGPNSRIKATRFDPDPIVIQRVAYGALIITKWGPEAEDPILNK